MLLKASSMLKGQNSWVPQVVKESRRGWVNSPQNISQDHSLQLADFSQREMSIPKRGANMIEKRMEWEKPLWISIAVTTSVKWLAKVSRSGMVPAIAP